MIIYISTYHSYAVIEREDPGTGWIIHTVAEVRAHFGQDEWPVKAIIRGFQSRDRAIKAAEKLEYAATQ